MLKKGVAVVLGVVAFGLATPTMAAAQTTAPPPAVPSATRSALHRAGVPFSDVAYDLFTGGDGAVVVTLLGPPALETPDQISSVVWVAEPNRFSDVVIRWSGGEVRRSYTELAATLGPRPAGFDRQTVAVAVFVGQLRVGFRFFDDAAAQRLFDTLVRWLMGVVIGLGALIGLWIAVGVVWRGRHDAPMPS